MHNNSIAQVESTLTIGAVRSLLSETLEQFKGVIETAGAEIKGVGNSLQANAQNVIKDIDDLFEDNLNLTFEKMDETQRNLFRDAQALTTKMQIAAVTIATVGGAEARKTIHEADITAYNTTYSLPCRSQVPRFVFSEPEDIRAGEEGTSVTIRGNFLDTGKEPSFTVGEHELSVVSRSANEIRLSLPDEVIKAITSKTELSIKAQLNYQKKTFWYLFCYDREVKQDKLSSASVTVLPARTIDVTGWIQPTVIDREERTIPHNVDLGRPGDCGVNIDASRQVCSADDWKVAGFTEFAIVSADCGSNAGPPQISGDRCVNVPGRIRGCGYDRVLGQNVNCRGRGWLHWRMKIQEYREFRAARQRFEIEETGTEKFSFTFTYPENAQVMNSPQWTYHAKIKIFEGGNTEEYEISQANENTGPVSGRLVDGTLSVAITPK